MHLKCWLSLKIIYAFVYNHITLCLFFNPHLPSFTSKHARLISFFGHSFSFRTCPYCCMVHLGLLCSGLSGFWGWDLWTFGTLGFWDCGMFGAVGVCDHCTFCRSFVKTRMCVGSMLLIGDTARLPQKGGTSHVPTLLQEQNFASTAAGQTYCQRARETHILTEARFGKHRSTSTNH